MVSFQAGQAEQDLNAFSDNDHQEQEPVDAYAGHDDDVDVSPLVVSRDDTR